MKEALLASGCVLTTQRSLLPSGEGRRAAMKGKKGR